MTLLIVGLSLILCVALLLDPAVAAGVITEEERQQVLDADVIRDEVIQVDAFDPEIFRSLRR